MARACACCREESPRVPRAGWRSGSTTASSRDPPSATHSPGAGSASVTQMDVNVFQLARGRAALEKYAAVNHVTVQIYGADGEVVAAAVNRTPLFDLFSPGHSPGMFAACARQCLTQSGPSPPVVIEERYGIAVV